MKLKDSESITMVAIGEKTQPEKLYINNTSIKKQKRGTKGMRLPN